MANELTKTEIKEIKISQNKLDEFSNEMTNATELIENSLRIVKNVALTKHTINNDFEEWKKQQKIVRINLNKEINQSVKNSQILIKNVINNTMANVGNAVENLTEDAKKKVKTDKKETVKLISNAEKGIKLLGKKMLSDYDKSIANVYKLRNQEPLFESILKETQTGIDKAPTKIYADGKEFSFKSYMEMNVRTTVRQEANQLLFNASKMNGVVFYICSFFGDCAKDHADYQGLYYYDEDWTGFGYDEETSQKIQEYIDSNNLMSYQQVIDEVGLTTRPNCRHSFRPVVLTDIIEEGKSAKDMLGEYKIIKGSYNDKNYIDLQTQRKNERAIRFYKTRLEEHKLQAKENPADPTLKNLIDKDIKLIKKWQTTQNDLLDSNPILKRDTRRENNKVLVQDLGAGYQLGLKIDGKNMYVKEKVKPVKEEKIKVEETVTYSETYKKLEKRLNEINVEYKEVKRHNTKLDEQEIIKRISGGDKTSGSCVSVGLTYIGQKLGYDVEDFRGGESCSFFATKYNVKEIFKFIPEENVITSYAKTFIASGNKLLKNIEIGKEYYFSCGKHASIVRKNDNGILQYLELQSENDSGWKNFNRNPSHTLSTRFGCRNTREINIIRELTDIEVTGYLVDIDSFKNSNDFVGILGYINTSSGDQKKGIGGFAK